MPLLFIAMCAQVVTLQAWCASYVATWTELSFLGFHCGFETVTARLTVAEMMLLTGEGYCACAPCHSFASSLDSDLEQ